MDIVSNRDNAFRIENIASSVYVHTSFLETSSFGHVPCNGVVFVSDREAIVVDTPVSDVASKQLLAWLRNNDIRVRGVVVSHFHVDSLGGLDAFHEAGVPAYVSMATRRLSGRDKWPSTTRFFDKQIRLEVGNTFVHNDFLGPGHSLDNIVSWFPDAKALFGGCLIKALGSGKGNMTDADVSRWSRTVMRVKATYGAAQWVIPGHGKAGGSELLDYTAKLFSEDAMSVE